MNLQCYHTVWTYSVTIQYEPTVLPYSMNPQCYRTVWTYSLTVQYEATVLPYSMNLQCYRTVWTYSVTIQYEPIVLPYSMNLQCYHTVWTYSVTIQYEPTVLPYSMNSAFKQLFQPYCIIAISHIKLWCLLFKWCLQTFDGKGPYWLLQAGSRTARGQITVSYIPNGLNYFVIFTVHTQFTTMAADCWPMV